MQIIFLIDQQIRDNNYLLTNNLFIFFIEFFIIFSNFYRLKALFDKNQITEDIFIFVAKDKIIFSSIISLSLLIFGSLIEFLVTGGSGYLGSSIIKFIKKKNTMFLI